MKNDNSKFKKIPGGNIDIDFSKVNGMVWEPGECPWGPEHKCAVKNTSMCDYFEGVEAPDIILCSYNSN
jgi:hypothetical protein